jgi:hypothetical protein
MTSALLALQSAFQEHLLRSNAAIEGSIAAGRGIAVGRRLGIYHHAYRARLIEALRDTFGHTATYLGQEWFDADALTFVQSHPSTESSLNRYGAGFAAWLLARHPHDADIGELAALDWALRRAFDGADAAPLDLATLAGVAPEAWQRIGFTFVPTMARLAMTHNTLALWHALDQNETPPTAQLLAEPSEVLIWRRGQQPHFRSLAAFESQALTALHRGQSFAAVCEHLADAFAPLDVSVEAGQLLRRWIDEALLCAVVDPSPPD